MGIYNLGGGGGAPELQAKEATPLITNAQQIILPDEGYDGLSKVTVNPMPTGALKTPTVNSIGYVSSGVQTAGYFDTSATSGLQLSTQNGGYVVPSTTNTVAILKGQYALDTIYVKGDANLIPTNIVSGKSIFGVSGSASSSKVLCGISSGNDSSSITVDLGTVPSTATAPQITTPTWYGVFATNFSQNYSMALYSFYAFKGLTASLYYSNGKYYGSSAVGTCVLGYLGGEQMGPTMSNGYIQPVINTSSQQRWTFDCGIFDSKWVLKSDWTYTFIIVGY